MSLVVLYLSGIYFLNKVFFPLISSPSFKNGEVIFDQSPFIDVTNLLNAFIIFTFVFYSYCGSTWYNWIFFIFPLKYFFTEVFNIIKRWNSQIIINNDYVYVFESKYDSIIGQRNEMQPRKFHLDLCTFKFEKDWNTEESTEFFKWKKYIRAHYITINGKKFNLNEMRLQMFFKAIVKEIRLRAPKENTHLQLNAFEKFEGIKWVSTIAFVLSLFVFFKKN